ncbi:hypothetical protein SUGI_0041640 [Cryptomeria japonica]|nr:hypothetical protein SUGI_0041640 [Cryptomeria japonica]
MKIFVRKENGIELILKVKSTETIGNVKDKIHEIECFHPLWQILLHRETELEDEKKTLDDYGLQHLSTIDLRRRLGEKWNPKKHRLRRR